jgi:delta 1-pyrroline-5-carboxylate dehydrogenase
VERVREWRVAHPGYWKRAKTGEKAPLQNAMKLPESAEPSSDQGGLDGGCATKRITALLREQSPVVVGLIVQMTGCTLQNAILEVAEKLFEKGRAVMGP